ncbi:hypothetical protein EYF80_028697 [Liparis tanakae]|uniref:Uncharacterized protein n=1 Tax=Liparis tanakae TaxID=230148 RepID=A0A4Z2H865_9TELE|nr:hypothetical protein EYF80_028697 [Liparis tanakae]
MRGVIRGAMRGAMRGVMRGAMRDERSDERSNERSDQTSKNTIRQPVKSSVFSLELRMFLPLGNMRMGVLQLQASLHQRLVLEQHSPTLPSGASQFSFRTSCASRTSSGLTESSPEGGGARLREEELD